MILKLLQTLVEFLPKIANAVKEAVLASILLSARDYIAANAWVNTLSGDDVPKQIEAGKKQFAGSEITGKTLGVIGLGAIGARIANDAYRLGMKVYGYDPYVSIEAAWNISHHVRRVSDLKEIFWKLWLYHCSRSIDTRYTGNFQCGCL